MKCCETKPGSSYKLIKPRSVFTDPVVHVHDAIAYKLLPLLPGDMIVSSTEMIHIFSCEPINYEFSRVKITSTVIKEKTRLVPPRTNARAYNKNFINAFSWIQYNVQNVFGTLVCDGTSTTSTFKLNLQMFGRTWVLYRKRREPDIVHTELRVVHDGHKRLKGSMNHR